MVVSYCRRIALELESCSCLGTIEKREFSDEGAIELYQMTPDITAINTATTRNNSGAYLLSD